MVTGEKHAQKIFSQIFTVMNKDIPDPIPQPLSNISSINIQRYPAATSYEKINNALNNPIYSTGPYCPE